MGSSGYGFDLQAKDGAKSGQAVRKAVVEFFTKAWRAALPEEQAEAATAWLNQGGDSPLMVLVYEGEDPFGDWENEEPADEVTFLMEESAPWGAELAVHWLSHAYAAGEATLLSKLAALGYTRAKGGWHPTREDLEARFLVDEDRVGKPEEDGMNWQLPADDAGMVDYEDLSEEEKAAAQKIRDGAPCQCAYCKKSKSKGKPAAKSSAKKKA